jgi:hypothetical protein
MANTNVTCQKGWIISPDPNTGETVPFFVQVRDSDVHYRSIDMDNTNVGILYRSGYGSQLQPSKIYQFSSNGWGIKFIPKATSKGTPTSGYAIMQYRMKIYDMDRNNANMLSKTIDVPLSIVTSSQDIYAGDNYTVECTVQSKTQCEALSVASFDITATSTSFSRITIKLSNVQIPFAENKSNLSGDSYIHIVVRGTHKL